MSIQQAIPLDPLIEGYLSYLDKVGRKTPRTIVDVRCTLRRAVTALGELRPRVDLWALTLEDFLHWLEAERRAGRTAMCLAKYLSHVRGFLEYAWRSGRTTRNVLDGFSLQHTVPRSAPKFLTLEEAERLVRSAAGPGIARRDRLIILLLYGCGLRTSELCALDVGDISRERQELSVRHGKGDRDRCIPMPEGLYTELVVERWNPHARVRQDLFGIVDVLAVGVDIVGVQATSASNVSKRVAKLTHSVALPILRKAGVRALAVRGLPQRLCAGSRVTAGGAAVISVRGNKIASRRVRPIAIRAGSVSNLKIRGNVLERAHDGLAPYRPHRVKRSHEFDRCGGGAFEHPVAFVELVIAKPDFASAVEHHHAAGEPAVVKFVVVQLDPLAAKFPILELHFDVSSGSRGAGSLATEGAPLNLKHKAARR